MKKILLPFLFMTTSISFIVLSCSQTKQEYELSIEQNKVIAKKMQNSFNKIKFIDTSDKLLNMKVSVNNNYYFFKGIDFDENISWSWSTFSEKNKFIKKHFWNGGFGINVDKFYRGFIDTETNLELINRLPGDRVIDLLNNGLIIEEPIDNNLGKQKYSYKLNNFNKVITTFDDLKTYLSYSFNTDENIESNLASKSSLDYLLNLKQEKLKNVAKFNNIDNNFFEENLILISTIGEFEEIVDIQFNSNQNELDVKTINIERNNDKSINWLKTVNENQQSRFNFLKNPYIPLVIYYNWHKQRTVMTVLNKKELGINTNNSILVNMMNLNDYPYLTKHYLNK
ncbi:hypothetical protein [Mycoplasma testudineum]|uniref:hypothetical protein n=1 Tax=Mycoplasma testudineum TaxID=244584 RepID=UPI000B93B9AC|nr:hypothetical protein [Mycoplasma testudineum]OYD26422.1 hypothetical protein CG473_04005 [Mycoplasma testudineum]